MGVSKLRTCRPWARLVLDMATGDLLKLAANGMVAAAQHGLKRPPLSPAEISQRYRGRPWVHLAALARQPRGSPTTFRSCLENFDAPAVRNTQGSSHAALFCCRLATRPGALIGNAWAFLGPALR